MAGLSHGVDHRELLIALESHIANLHLRDGVTVVSTRWRSPVVFINGKDALKIRATPGLRHFGQEMPKPETDGIEYDPLLLGAKPQVVFSDDPWRS